MGNKIQSVSIIVSKGHLEGAYPPLILANGAIMEQIKVRLFFTFYGLDVIRKDKMCKLPAASVGNPSLPIPAIISILPGVPALVSRIMRKRIEKLGIPPIPDLLHMIKEGGGELYGCKASSDMVAIPPEALCTDTLGILTVLEFFDKSKDSEIIFT